MTHDWKAGDWAMVQLGADYRDGRYWAIQHGNHSSELPVSALHPLPAPDPLQAVDKAVAEAADVWRDTASRGAGHLQIRVALMAAVDARRALLKPRDLVQELLDALAMAIPPNVPLPKLQRITTAIAALEAERKRKD